MRARMPCAHCSTIVFVYVSQRDYRVRLFPCSTRCSTASLVARQLPSQCQFRDGPVKILTAPLPQHSIFKSAWFSTAECTPLCLSKKSSGFKIFIRVQIFLSGFRVSSSLWCSLKRLQLCNKSLQFIETQEYCATVTEVK